MKKLFSTLLILAAALFAFGADAKSDRPIKIGVILPLTGNMAQVGQPQLAAVELFKAECAKNSYKHKYEIIVEDDALTGRMTAEAAMKLINVDNVDGLVTLSSGSGNIVAARAKNSGTPHLCVASDPKIADAKTNFLHWALPETCAHDFVNLIEKLGGKRIAILALRQQGSMTLMKLAEPEMKKRGMEIVYNEYFNPGERDFRTTLLKIKETKPNLFIPFAFSPEMEIILKQRKHMGLDAKVSTMECFDMLDYTPDAEGLFYITEGRGTPKFIRQLGAMTGKASNWGVPYTYDCLNILRAAYETMDTPNRAAAAKYISQLKDFPSALGTISMRPDGRIESPASLFRIVNGKPTPAKWEDVK